MTLFLFCLAIVVVFAQRPDDCTAESCGVHGTCKLDGVCACSRGYRGASCALGPPPLVKGFSIPGQLDDRSTEAFFSVLESDFGSGTTVEIKTVGASGPVNVFGSVGVVPDAENFQFSFPASQMGELEFDSNELSPLAPIDAPKDLFLVLQATNGPSQRIQFSIRVTGGATIAGLPAWLFVLLIVLAVLCCCISVGAGVVFFLKRKRGATSRRVVQSGRELQPGYANRNPQQVSSDYPSANMVTAGSAMVQPTNDYPSVQESQRQPVYDAGGHYGQQGYSSTMGGTSMGTAAMGGGVDTGFYDLQGQSTIGSESTMYQRPPAGSSAGYSGGMTQGSNPGGGYHDDEMLPMW